MHSAVDYTLMIPVYCWMVSRYSVSWMVSRYSVNKLACLGVKARVEYRPHPKVQDFSLHRNRSERTYSRCMNILFTDACTVARIIFIGSKLLAMKPTVFTIYYCGVMPTANVIYCKCGWLSISARFNLMLAQLLVILLILNNP
jgi:hypothetical protein